MNGNFIAFTGETLYCLLQIEFDTFLLQMLMHKCSHRVVDRSHHLWSHLHDSHLCAGMLKIFGHLKTDEPSSHYNGSVHLVMGDICLDTVGVADISKGKYPFALYARQWRNNGRCAGREQQLVIALGIAFAVRAFYCHLFCSGVNGCHFASGAYVDVESFAKGLGCLHKKLVTLFYHASDVIGKSTVGIRDMFSFFKQNNLCIFCQPPDSGSGSSTAGNSTYYHVFLFILGCGHIL